MSKTLSTMSKTERKCRLTEYRVQIRKEPHRGWESPYGWGPFFALADAERACREADKLWMSARVSSTVRDMMLTDDQIANIRRLGQPLVVLPSPHAAKGGHGHYGDDEVYGEESS